MQKSKEQKLIISSSLKTPLIKINALAGTGKTTTLIFVAESNPDDNILYMVFNKANQLEAVKVFPENVEPRTVHSLAYRAVAQNTNINLNNIVKYSYKEIADMYDIDYNQAFFVFKAFEEYCNGESLEFNRKDSISKKMFKDMDTGKIPPTYSFLLKKFHLLLVDGNFSHSYTMAMIDESQDTNLVTLAIFNLLKIDKKVYVGDDNQRIYSFRGSKNIFNYVNGLDLFLSETYRSNKKIVNFANIVLKRFKDYPVDMTTNVKDKNKISDTAYVSRTNSSLIVKMDNLISDGKKFKTIREPSDIFSLVLDLYHFKHREFFKIKTNRYLKKFKNIEEVEDYADMTDSTELITALKILKKFGKKLFDIKAIADKYFYDRALKVNIFLTTAHTSKGLEWDKVIIVDDFKEFSTIVSKAKFKSVKKFRNKIDKINPEIIDEINLMYVAITRARQDIEIPKKLKRELEMSEKELNKIIKEKFKESKKKR